MARRRYGRKAGGNPAVLLILIALVAHVYGFTPEMAAKVLTYSASVVAVGVLIVAVIAILKRARRRHILRNAGMAQVDSMSGLEFECYVAELLKAHGFTSVKLTERYDWGVDIIAHKDGIRWGVQTKRSSGLVRVAAVRQVVGALNMYQCERAMVITNGLFSRPAIEIAKSNRCTLIDRTHLTKLVANNKGTS